MTLPVAAIVSKHPADADLLLASFVTSLKSRGFRVRGLAQTIEFGEHGCDIVLLDFASGTRHRITQDLGKGSDACRLDLSRLVEAGGALRNMSAEATDLAVFNRFGALESQGGGFRAEMLAALSIGVPLLTVVSEKHLAAWRIFTGGLADELQSDIGALATWFAKVHAARSSNPVAS